MKCHRAGRTVTLVVQSASQARAPGQVEYPECVSNTVCCSVLSVCRSTAILSGDLSGMSSALVCRMLSRVAW